MALESRTTRGRAAASPRFGVLRIPAHALAESQRAFRDGTFQPAHGGGSLNTDHALRITERLLQAGTKLRPEVPADEGNQVLLLA